MTHIDSGLLPAGRLALLLAGALLTGCGDTDGRVQFAASAQSCMQCHNGSQADDYAGPGLEDPHPFPGAEQLQCTTCHGGNPNGADRAQSHVPPPPEIGDREQWRTDREAYFNRLTLTGVDKYPDYTVNGVTYTALDYLQFVNPGDLRVTQANRGCGQCHAPHSDAVAHSLLATEAGVLSGATYAAGIENQVAENRGLYHDTAADLGFRAVQDDMFASAPAEVGRVGRLAEYPVHSVHGVEAPNSMFRNQNYDALLLHNYLNPDNSVQLDSPLAHVYQEQVAFTCGDCHLGSAGANNRYGDFRSSGCTACHMPYSLDGRSRSLDPNVPKDEPLDPDDIDPPELSHVRAHRIASVRRDLPNGERIEGIDDHTCAGCHQGSNRTVMQYWGIRLDQNQDLRNGVQYPANPQSFVNTRDDTRLFDPAVGNRTFNGRNHHQYIAFEDYDGDGRDDTPPDVHAEAGMGCIDCHGTHDLHGGVPGDPAGDRILSRMEQAVAIACESCHGSVDSHASTVAGTTYAGAAAQVAVDTAGNPLPHVVRESDGHFYLTSRVTGRRHFVPQTRDTVVDSGVRDPFDNQPVYSPRASYAMGRADGDPNTGIGPLQNGVAASGFSHADTMSCASCHSAWTNTCMGCHLEGDYDTGNNFSNITGQRIVFREREADFVYQSPVFFQLGVGPRNRIEQVCANTKTFFTYEDLNGNRSRTMAFSDRNGGGANPATGHPSLSHNAMMAHSIRGRVTATDEGPRYCVACHLTDNALATHGAAYDAFRTAMANGDFSSLDFNQLRQHFGQNPSNQLDSPLWVHMVAGLGSGLFLFDQNGCPTNPLDNNVNRAGCNGVAPASIWDPARVFYNLDRIVDGSGASTGSSNHVLLAPGGGAALRTGAQNPAMAGPLGATLIQRLTDPITGIVLNSWIDADGQLRGQAGAVVQ